MKVEMLVRNYDQCSEESVQCDWDDDLLVNRSFDEAEG
jgi:hypothetical protein